MYGIGTRHPQHRLERSVALPAADLDCRLARDGRQKNVVAIEDREDASRVSALASPCATDDPTAAQAPELCEAVRPILEPFGVRNAIDFGLDPMEEPGREVVADLAPVRILLLHRMPELREERRGRLDGLGDLAVEFPGAAKRGGLVDQAIRSRLGVACDASTKE